MSRMRIAVAAVLCLCAVEAAWSQVPGGGPGGPRPRGPGGGEEKKEMKLPDDPKLRQIHGQFVTAAEKLAGEYERANQMDKARACYEEILRLVPNYPPAEEKLGKIRERESTAQRKIVDVMANQGWQDTGIRAIEGKPLVFKADGSWTFRVSYQLDANGIPIPAELRDFNLGSLVGMIIDPSDASSASAADSRPGGGRPGAGATGFGGNTGGAPGGGGPGGPGGARPGGGPGRDRSEGGPRPFFVGNQLELTAPRTGRVFLRMYDADPSDNVGKVTVTITGTFETK